MSTEKQPNKWVERFIKKPPKVKRKIKRKWLAYLILYIIGYIISLCVTGIPSLDYLIPFKLDALCFSIFIGETVTSPPVDIKDTLSPRWRGFVFGVISAVLVLIFIIVIYILETCNIITNLDPFFGIFGILKKS
ncbi:hypothetical protein HBE96_19135 [Clostridium sp. P21]|uniref:Uncharacterized protein n=1 Tax=Clostridium muellerianum TaxID=2716538 RepID=A0A7Y0HR21_9CLOT|nr:hypothetical protein [Clostridium muellerianum]NMM64726.1 hypothetical protein [Clostridium muellerianum]